MSTESILPLKRFMTVIANKILDAKMYGGDMYFQITLPAKGFMTMIANEILDAIMCNGDMRFQPTLICKRFMTLVATKILILYAVMYSGNMLSQTAHMPKGFVTMRTNIFLDPVMDSRDMLCQINLMSKSLLT